MVFMFNYTNHVLTPVLYLPHREIDNYSLISLTETKQRSVFFPSNIELFFQKVKKFTKLVTDCKNHFKDQTNKLQ